MDNYKRHSVLPKKKAACILLREVKICLDCMHFRAPHAEEVITHMKLEIPKLYIILILISPFIETTVMMT